jgi:predicted ATPase/class 3 adenylate cyclase
VGRPTGTVTFLFTDVAGSTRLWDVNSRVMSTSLAVHDRIIRRAAGDHAGYVFSTAGDSFAVAFHTATDAVGTAVDAQLALNAEPWNGPPIRVRMGIHTGSSEERAAAYFGSEVNSAARIMSAANGGQVLVSAATAQLLAQTRSGYELVDRGVHALRDLDRPEHLFELRHPRLPEVREALHTVDPVGTHLPTQPTAFVGRRAELKAVAELVGSARLVTLTGAGGTGKTRLSIQAASQVHDRFPDGVWMAELAPISDPGRVINEIAELWGLRAGQGVDVLQVVKSYLDGRRLLIVLDNCEHVLGAAASAVAELLGAAPELRFLATSRESLGLPGEAVYRLPSLGLPGSGSNPAESDSVRLFLERAGRKESEIPSSELDAVVRICRRLDGMPLGIELAVARLRTLTPVELADRLEDSLRFLGSNASVPRQRTLHTTIDWSYDLLDPDEARMFRRMSVFAGGFDLTAAEAIGGDEKAEEWEVVDLIDQLVDKSLINADHAGGQTRFRMLEPIRQYGRERLAAAGEAEDVHVAHGHYYAEYVSHTEPRFRGPDQRRANDELLLDIGNIRLALSTLLERGEFDRFLETCFSLSFFWTQSGLLVEGREVLLEGLHQAGEDASPQSIARGWFVASMLATYVTDPRTVEYADRGLGAARAAGDAVLVGWLSLMRGVAYANLVGHENNQHWFDEGTRLITENPGRPMWDHEWDVAFIEFLLAFGRSGSRGEQREHITEGIARAGALGDNYLAAMTMVASSYLRDEQPDWALARLQDAVDVLRGLDFRHALGHALYYLGAKMQDTGIGDGVVELSEGSAMLAEVGDLPCSTWSSARLIRSMVLSGDLEKAAKTLEKAVDRLTVFEQDVSSDLPVLACRLAVAHGNLTIAARLVGHLAARRDEASGDLNTCREAVEEGLAEAEVELFVAEGAAADWHQVLQWMRAAAV